MASVKVAVRVRPLNEREEKLKSFCVVKVEGKKTQLFHNRALTSVEGEARETVKEFTFDYSYWSCIEGDSHYASQSQLYEDLGTNVVSSALQGYNACVFAYGQTGSGKTFTMMGADDNPGLIPRISKALFDEMEKGREKGMTYKVEVSYLEIYNEKVKDLLRFGRSSHRLKIREHPKYGPYVEHLSNHHVSHYSGIKLLMDQGNARRTTASTEMNDTSSRSHAIFTINFIQANMSTELPLETRSKIHLVDLAGSERADSTGSTGLRLKEGAHINKSLVTLGSVISSLAEQSFRKDLMKSVFIPYRDSVLTWLLKDSLGGNSQTIMIATISPAYINYGETLSTLRYANRAKNIINKPTVNEDPNVKLIRELREEITKLKSMLMNSFPEEGKSEAGLIREELSLKQAQEKVLTDQWTEKWCETRSILQEQKTLGLRKAGQGVVLDSDHPHLVLIDDVLSTGVTLYHLNSGITTIGTSDSQDIKLEGSELLSEHCFIHLQDGIATLEARENASCWVNSVPVEKLAKLSQGCVIVLGGSHMFRYNDPFEAARLRKEGSSLHLNLSRLSFLSRSATDIFQSADSATCFDSDLSARSHTDDFLHVSSSLVKRSRCSEATDLCEMSTQTSFHLTSPATASCTKTPGDSSQNVCVKMTDASDKVENENLTDIDASATASFYSAVSALSPDLRDTVPTDVYSYCAKSVLGGSPVREAADRPSDLAIIADSSVISPIVKMEEQEAAVEEGVDCQGTCTSTPKKPSNNAFMRASSVRQLLHKKESEHKASCEDGAEGMHGAGDRSGFFSGSDEITEADIQKLKETAENGDVSAQEQLEELRSLHCHYASLEDAALWKQHNSGLCSKEDKHEDSGLCSSDPQSAKIISQIYKRPVDLTLDSSTVLAEERIALLIEQEVQRRLLEGMVLQEDASSRSRAASMPCYSPDRISHLSNFQALTSAHPYVEYGECIPESCVEHPLPAGELTLQSSVDCDIEAIHGIFVSIPRYEMRGTGSFAHWEFEVHLTAGSDSWMVFRRFRRFRELHLSMCEKYGGHVCSLNFPRRRLFGNTSEKVVVERREQLEAYLQQLIVICMKLPGCPLSALPPSRSSLGKLSGFFQRGVFEIARHTTS